MSVETTLPHGLKTSVLGSAYKTEQDQNLSLLDNDRITVGPVASRPAFGIARRFWFDPATKQLSYDDGTQWLEDLTRQSSLIVESLSILNQDLTTDADVNFNSITTGSINASGLSLTTPLSISSGGTGQTSSNVDFSKVGSYFKISKGSIQTVPSGINTTIVDYSDGESTNNTVTIDLINGTLTFIRSGKYYIYSSMYMPMGTDNFVELLIVVNGTTIHSSRDLLSAANTISIAGIINISVNDVLRIDIIQASGSNQLVSPVITRNYVHGFWVSE